MKATKMEISATYESQWLVENVPFPIADHKIIIMKHNSPLHVTSLLCH